MLSTCYVPYTKKIAQAHGLSEREIRKRLEQEGWIVWRGSMLNAIKEDDLYPVVRKKYQLLSQLLVQDFPKYYDELQYICAVHHGIPDFLCYRSKTKEWKFVECKFLHEQLSARQWKCIAKLLQMGFHVEIQRLVNAKQKMLAAHIDITTRKKIIFERQTTLRGRGKIKIKI